MHDVRVQVPSLAPITKSQKSLKSGVSEIFLLSENGFRCLFGVYGSLLCIQKRESMGFAGVFVFMTDLPFFLSMLRKISPDSIEENDLNAIGGFVYYFFFLGLKSIALVSASEDLAFARLNSCV